MTGDDMMNNYFYSNMMMCIFIIPKIFGTLSIICSAFVAQDVLKLPERYAKMTNHVILALRIFDIIFSTSCHIFGTWLVPQGLVYGSSGNQGTCTAQGFLILFSVSCIMRKEIKFPFAICSWIYELTSDVPILYTGVNSE